MVIKDVSIMGVVMIMAGSDPGHNSGCQRRLLQSTHRCEPAPLPPGPKRASSTLATSKKGSQS